MTQQGSLSIFEARLHQRRLSPENRIPYLVRWVERYLRFSALRPSEAWHDTLQVFLKGLGDGMTPEWQIRQAADAISQLLPKETPGRMLTNPRGWCLKV